MPGDLQDTKGLAPVIDSFTEAIDGFEPVIDRFVQIIDGFNPQEAATRLPKLMRGGGDSPLAGMIVRSSAHDTEPILSLLGSIENLIENVADTPELQASLGHRAVQAVAGAMERDDFPAGPPERIRALAGKADGFADFQGDRAKNASLLLHISQAIVHAGVTGGEPASLFGDAEAYVERAAGLAVTDSDPIGRWHALIKIADGAAENIKNSGGDTRGHGEGWHPSSPPARQQPAKLYEQVIDAVDSIENPAEQGSRRGQTIVAMLEAAVDVKKVDFGAYDQLVIMSIGQIDEVVAAYDADGDYTDHTPEAKCAALVALGSELGRILDEGFAPLRHSFLKQQLVERTGSVFQAARDNVQQAEDLASESAGADFDRSALPILPAAVRD